MRPSERSRSWSWAALLAAALAACAQRSHGSAPQANPCVRCHMPEYLSAKKPLHVGVRPTACAVCHHQDSWSPSVFEHPWPLTGAHQSARCADCHLGQPPVYAGTSKLCVGCHRDDYDQTDYPGHANFSTTCTDCHSTSAWKPARKPLSEHVARSDVRASKPEHASSTLETPRAPPGARKPARSVAPKHAARSAQPASAAREPPPENTVEVAPSEPAAPDVAPTPSPTQEAAPAVHPERRFPIASGSHAGIRCRTCHDQGGVMGKDDTDCVQCHARAKFDRIHDGVRGYPDGSAPLNFCLHCHAAGRVRGR